MIDYRHQRARRHRIRRVILRLAIVICIVNAIQQGPLVAVRMRGAAMRPTLDSRDVVYGTKIVYGNRRGLQRLLPQLRAEPSYGDIVYVRSPYVHQRRWTIHLLDVLLRFFTLQRARALSEPRLVRRIIALPGDTVSMENFQFFVRSRHGEQPQSEFTRAAPYRIMVGSLPASWKRYYPFSSQLSDYTVPPGHYFVAADNRIGTLDSRVWGAIPHDAVIAPLLVVYRFPFSLRVIHRTSARP